MASRIFSSRLLLNIANLSAIKVITIMGKIAAIYMISNSHSLRIASQFALLLSISEIARVVADLNADVLILSRIAKLKKYTGYVNQFILRLRICFGALLTLVLLYAVTFFDHDSVLLILFALIPLGTISSSLWLVCSQKVPAVAVSRIVGLCAVLSSIALVLLVGYGEDVLDYVAMVILPELLLVIALGWLGKEHILDAMFGYKSPPILRGMAIYSKLLANAAINVCATTYSRFDSWLVLPLFGATAQLTFSLVQRMVDPIVLVVAVGGNAVLVDWARSAHEEGQVRWSSQSVKDGYRYLSNRWTLNSIVLVIAGIIIACNLLMVDNKVSIVLVVLLTTPFKVVSIMSSVYLYKMGKSELVLISAITVLVIISATTLVLSTYIGINAVLIAVALGEYANAMIQSIYARRVKSGRQQKI